MASEDTLLQRIQSRDPAERDLAEAELFKTFEVRIRTVLSRVLGSGPDLDDAVQETFVDIFRGLPKFEGRSKLSTWIYRVTLRRGWKCAARERAARRNRVEVESIDAYPAASTAANGHEVRELADRLERAMKQLDVDQRNVLALSACDALPPPEIARILGVPVGTVHSRLSRARAKLRTLLQLDPR